MRFLLLFSFFWLIAVQGQTQVITPVKDSTHTNDSTKNFPDENYFKTHFLWFTGHWNNEKTIFTTTASRDTSFSDNITIGGSGITLNLSPDGKVTLHSKEIDNWNVRVTNALDSLKKNEDELNTASGNLEWAHHYSESVAPEIKSLKREWQSYQLNKNPELADRRENKLSPDKGISYQQLLDNITKWCQTIKPDYEKVIAYYKAHRHDKESDLVNPPPPEQDFSCFSCDTNLARQHEIEDSIYSEQFMKPEVDLIKIALGIERGLLLIGFDENGGISDPEAINTYGLLFSHKHVCSYLEFTTLQYAVQFFAERLYQRGQKLLIDYRHNVKTAEPVIRTALSTTRAALLLGLQLPEKSTLPECGNIMKEVCFYYRKKLIEDHDWSLLANIPYFFQLERDNLTLSGSGDMNNLKDVLGILNCFHLYIEMDVKLGDEGKGYEIAHLKGETKVAPEFNYNDDSCYRWVAVEDQPDYNITGLNGWPMPRKKALQKIECSLVDNEMVAPGPRPEYIGTKKYWVLLKGLKMDYCHPGSDTILLTGFIPEPNAMTGTWRFPRNPNPVPLGINNVDHVFQDVSKMEELVNSGKVQQQAEIMKQQGGKIEAQMKAIESKMNDPQTQLNLGEMKKLYTQMQELSTKAQSLGTSENSAPVLYIDFPLEIKNNTETLLNKRYDAKEINPEETPAIIYAYYTVKVVYEPKDYSKPGN